LELNFLDEYLSAGISGLPKYVQLREALRSAIKDGNWGPGAQLPPEAELARAVPFSLGTVQKALKALVEEGVVVRRQGHGTFVAEERRRMDAPWHCRFSSDEEGVFLPVYPKLLLRKRIKGQAPWARLLNPKNSSIIQIDRTIGIGQEFSVYSKVFLNGDRFGGFLDKTIEELESTNFKNILRREYNLPITRMSHELRMITIPAHICRAIEIPPQTFGLLLQIVASSGQKNPVYYQEIFIPPNKRKLYISDSSNVPEY